MKHSWIKPLLWTQALVIIALAAGLAYIARGELPGSRARDSSDVTAPPRVAAKESSGLRIAESARQAEGIQIAAATAYILKPHREIFGAVVNLQPLIHLRGQLQAAAAEREMARAAMNRAETELQRMQALYADDRNVSQRALQTAESDQAATRARFAGATAAVDNLQLQLRQGWGERLANWVSKDPAARETTQLLQGQDVLVEIAEAGLPATTVDVRLPGSSSRACQARFVSRAAQTEPGSVLTAYYYRCAGAALPGGARIQVRLALAGEGRHGVRVPGSALVWHGGKPWIYLQRDGDRFERHDATGTESIGEDWFIPDLSAGSRVVAAGAQILLSGEMRYQIKNENED